MSHEDVAFWISEAHRHAGRGAWDEACAALRHVAEALPGAAGPWIQIAQWQSAQGHRDAALDTLGIGVSFNDRRPEALPELWHAVTMHLFEDQQWAHAGEAAQKGIESLRELRAWAKSGVQPQAGPLEPQAQRLREHEMLEMLATSRAHEGLYEAAGEAMRALLVLSPRDPLHRMRLASLLQSHGALGEAAIEFERVLEMAPGTFFARDAESALDLLDKAQIQQILTRAGEQRSFGLRLERDMEGTLESHSFHLSESGRESLRQMIDDGRPDLSGAPRMH